MKSRIAFFAVLLMLGMVLADVYYFPMPQPPRGAVQVKVGDSSFYSGVIYLSAAGDTSLLKTIGFREFIFDGRSVSSLRYRTLWPHHTLRDSLPSSVSGLEYDVDTTALTPDITPDDLLLPGQSEPTPDDEPVPQPNPNGQGNQ